MNTTLEKERHKYRRMWAQNSYRQYSPGADAVESFLKECNWKPGETVADLGCGTGRAAKGLSEAGLKPTLFDMIPEAVETKEFPFHEVNLWDLPRELQPFDWIFCVDVLEHIPPEHIEPTLKGLNSLTRKGGYIQVCCVPDGCGRSIGEELHLTINPPEWWLEQLSQRWPTRFLGEIMLRNLPRTPFAVGPPRMDDA